MSHEERMILRNSVSLGPRIRENGVRIFNQPVMGSMILAKWLQFQRSASSSIIQGRQMLWVFNEITPACAWFLVSREETIAVLMLYKMCCLAHENHRLARASGESSFLHDILHGHLNILLYSCCYCPSLSPHDETIPSGSPGVFLLSRFFLHSFDQVILRSKSLYRVKTKFLN